MIEPASCTMSIYGLSPKCGFLPEWNLSSKLADRYYQPWETLVHDLPVRLSTDTFRADIGRMPILETTKLRDESEWRRAYVVLSFFAHAYIWGGSKPSQRLPSAISVPFINVADHFALPTTATYAGLNLWNWAPASANADISLPQNVRMLHTFTGTQDEAWFYAISVSIEVYGATIISTMLNCFEAVRSDDDFSVRQSLERIASTIDQMGATLKRMYERCDPAIFYHHIRPYLAGSKGMEAAGLPQGVFYEEEDGTGRWRQYSGGSNAQSSLIQLLDIMLGVEHYSTGGCHGQEGAKSGKGRPTYLLEMRNYMPGSHRHFLSYAERSSNIRAFVQRAGCASRTRTAYQSATASLTLFRDIHIQIVHRYIIAPSQQPPQDSGSERMNLAIATSTQGTDGTRTKELSGTGGTALIPFLKQTRDDTRNAGRIAV